jgi:Rieske Fe-S protein
LQVNELEGPTAVGDVLVVREPTGRVLAFSRRCPHLGCSLSVSEARDGFTCPCHGSRFDLMGRRVAGPAERDLTGLQVVPQAQDRVKIE